MDTKAREMIVSLVTDLRRERLRGYIYLSLLQGIEEHPEIVKNWRTLATEMTDRPDVGATVLLDRELQPLIDYALQGLSHDEAQALLDRVGRLHLGIQ